FEHQATMPETHGPEGLASEVELARERVARQPEASLAGIPEKLLEQAVCDKPIEIRPVDPYDIVRPSKRPPRRHVWYRAVDRLPDRLSVHQYLLAYASDFHFVTTAMQPHGVSWLSPGMQVASLDHAMWFHRPFRMDEWLLYVVDSP